MQDLRYAFRLLRRSPGFAAVAIFALALGIGANTAIFSVVDAVLLQQLPFAEPDRLVMVWEENSRIGFPRNTPAPANWVDWSKQNTVFTGIAATRGALRTLTGDGPPENVTARRVTANFWEVLGSKPLLGRTFTEDEDRQNARVAVISERLWQRRFGGAPNIIGRKVTMTDEVVEVIGVMPAQFVFPNRGTEIWMPSEFTAEVLARRNSHFLQCIARLKPGISVEQAQTEMTVIAKRLEAQYPETNRTLGAVVVPVREQMVGNLRVALTALLAAAGCVLLIACANLANLLLARATGRRQEMAIRAAMGANRGRIVRQMLAESLMLSGLGALAGLGVARIGMLTLSKLVPNSMAAPQLSLDLRLLAFTAVVAVATGVLFGLAPALSLLGSKLHDTIKQGGRGNVGSRWNWMRDALIVTEVALALILLCGAGWMIQTLDRLARIDTGLRADHLLTMGTDLPPSRYRTAEQREAFANSVVAKVRTIPGVAAAGYTSCLPLTCDGNTSGYVLPGQNGAETDTQDALFRVVTPGFHAALGASLREGRFFSDDDREQSAPVAIVNETFANRHWPGQSALGKQFGANAGPTRVWMTIVGVVKEIRERGIDSPLKAAMYTPLAQSANYWPQPQDLVIRTSVVPEAMTAAARDVIWSIDKDQPVTRVRTMEEVAERGIAARRQSMTLLSGFAGLALLLASLGIYGVLSYMVAQQTREIGVRMSLGATPGGILVQVVRRGLVLVGLGLVIGLGGTLAAGRYVSALLYEVKPQDPATIIAVSAMLLAVAAAACLVPAWRASRVDPVIALRGE
ncbi:MAG: ABC transporter permease [Acidobacteria bacterium]|nr:ABC transporter permease [Acidobacteriota bacterium]